MGDNIFDRNRYSRDTKNVFEVISSYYVDIYYNHLFIEARKLWEAENVDNISDGYRHSVYNMLQSFDNPEFYKTSLTQLFKYFYEWGVVPYSVSKTTTMLIIKQFVPSDFHESLNNSQKTAILKTIISQANREFIALLIQPEYISIIIDDHSNHDNVRLLQDKFIDCLILEREKIYCKFINTNINITKKNSSSVINDNTNIQIIQKLKMSMENITKENYKLKEFILKLKHIIVKKDRDYKELEGQYNKIITNKSNDIHKEIVDNGSNEIDDIKPHVNDDDAQDDRNQIHFDTSDNNINNIEYDY